MVYMNKIRSVDFPIVKRNRRYIGFTNGLLDIVSGEILGEDVLESGEKARMNGKVPRTNDCGSVF